MVDYFYLFTVIKWLIYLLLLNLYLRFLLFEDSKYRKHTFEIKGFFGAIPPYFFSVLHWNLREISEWLNFKEQIIVLSQFFVKIITKRRYSLFNFNSIRNYLNSMWKIRTNWSAILLEYTFVFSTIPVFYSSF